MNYVIPGPVHPINLPKAQQGVVLIVGLIMVLLISLIALAAIRGSGLQELMAGNVRDRNLAFQAAEAGLREAEERFAPGASHPAFDGSDVGFMEALNGSTNSGYWDNYSWTSQSVQTSLSLDGVSQAPRYVVEKVIHTPVAGSDGGSIEFNPSNNAPETLYRITALGYGATEGSTVILQSTFKRAGP